MTTRPPRKKKFHTAAFSNYAAGNAEELFRSGRIAARKVLSPCAPAIAALQPRFLSAEKLKGQKFTMGVDKYFRCYVGEDFVLEQAQLARDVSPTRPCRTCGATQHHELAYIGGTICHEAWHLIRKHASRYAQTSFGNFRKWNIAADLELNDDLIQCFTSCDKPRLCLPEMGVWPEKFRRTPDYAKKWEQNPTKAQLDAITDPVKKFEFLAQLHDVDAEQYYCWKQVAQFGEEIWEQFVDGKLGEEYYMLLPSPPPCPVHGEEGDKSQGGSCGGHGEKSDEEGDKESGDGSGGDEGDEEGDGDGDGDSSDGGQGHSHGGTSPGCTCPWTVDHGSGVGGETRDHEDGEPSESSPGISEAEGRKISREVAKKVSEAQRSRGNMPAGMARWADEELGPPKYDWRTELQKACRWGASFKSGSEVRTFRRLGLLTGSTQGKILYPTKVDPIPDITVVFDTSGSMDAGALKAGLEEVDGIMDAIGARIRFTSVDASASELVDVENIKDVKLTGGGGTDMRVGIEAALADPNRKPSVIIVMTDGYTPWPDAPINDGMTKLICCMVGGYTAELDSVPEWALGIKITEDDADTKAING